MIAATNLPPLWMNPRATPTLLVAASPKFYWANAAAFPTRLSEIFMAGGPMMWPLAACSVVMLMFAIERQVVLRRRRVIPKDFVTRFLEHVKSGQIDRSGALAPW